MVGGLVTNNQPFQPIRTCIATRERRVQNALLRCVAVAIPEEDSGPHGPTVRIVPDPQRRLSGRGAWITPSLEALDVAIKRRAFQRALRLSTQTVDTDLVRVYVASNAPA